MVCPKCGSENVNVQVVTDAQLVNAKKGCLWWCFVGWWWVPVKWIAFTLPALFAAFLPKKQKLKQNTTTHCVCQNCGHSWKV